MPIAVPGLPQPLRLGLAGGARVVALVLGRRGRIGQQISAIFCQSARSAHFRLR